MTTPSSQSSIHTLPSAEIQQGLAEIIDNMEAVLVNPSDRHPQVHPQPRGPLHIAHGQLDYRHPRQNRYKHGKGHNRQGPLPYGHKRTNQQPTHNRQYSHYM